MTEINNILTVDVEECFHRNDFILSRQQRELLGGKVVEQTEQVIYLLQSYGQRGTFFILGEIAEEYPHLVRRLAQAGFELGVHSYRHQLVYTQKKEEFHQEVKKAKLKAKSTGIKKPAIIIKNSRPVISRLKTVIAIKKAGNITIRL